MPNNRYLWKEVAKQIEESKYPIIKCPSYLESKNVYLERRIESLGRYLIEHPIATDWMIKYEELLELLPEDWVVIFPWDVETTVEVKLTIKDKVIKTIKRFLKWMA